MSQQDDSLVQRKYPIHKTQQNGLSLKESLRGASSWKPCAFQWRSCSLQLLLSWALEKPISVTAHSLTVLLSSTAPFKLQLSDHLPSSINCQEQLLSYTTISPRSRSRTFPLSHWRRTSASHVPAHCLELLCVSGGLTVAPSPSWALRGRNHGQGRSSMHRSAKPKPYMLRPLSAVPCITKLSFIFI